MYENAETFELDKGFTVQVIQDTDGDTGNPRDADNLGVLFAPHRNYTLGDAGFPSAEHDDAARAFEHFTEYGSRGGIRAFERWLRVYLGASVVLKVGMIDHSGLSMYVGGGSHAFDSGGWDSGTVGVIFDTASTREGTGCTPENGFDTAKIEEGLIGEVQEYDKFLTGDVWGYQVIDPAGQEVDSCWGFLGYDYAVQEAKEAAAHYIDGWESERDALIARCLAKYEETPENDRRLNHLKRATGLPAAEIVGWFDRHRSG